MLISAIICTYGRAATLAALLDCLLKQTHPQLEILLVDGNEPDSPARAAIHALALESRPAGLVRIVHSRRGLTRQRNAGLRAAHGGLIAFLDDDVTFGPGFIAQAVELFERPALREAGGITGYDVLTYGIPLAARWRIRKFFGAIPSLKPGDIDHLGRAVPVNFVKPFSGFLEVGWLAGFCMIYRREAVRGLEFDECLPTYGGEDREFSIQVGQRWKLLFCGDLRLKHHGSPEGRGSEVYRMLQNSFGAGRRFAKGARGMADYLVMARTLFGDLVVDALSFLSHPSRGRFLVPWARARGLFAGMRSVRSATPPVWEPDGAGRKRMAANS